MQTTLPMQQEYCRYDEGFFVHISKRDPLVPE